MRMWSEMTERLRAVFLRAREERELAKELAFHLEMETEKNVRAGMTAAAARRQAHISLGGSEQISDDVRAARGIGWLEHGVRDARHAWRSILRMPALAVVVILSLGVGIGVNTAIFSWIQAVVLEPIPGVSGAGNYFLVEPRNDDAADRRSGLFMGMSWLEYRDLREELRSFEQLVAFRTTPLTIGERGSTTRAFGQLVSDNYFTALSLAPAIGRLLTEDAARTRDEHVVVISHDYWQSQYDGSAAVVGRALRVNDRDLTIIGVAPRDFQGTVLGLTFDMWIPASLAPSLLPGSRELEDRGTRGYTAMGRLRTGTTDAQAQSEVDAAMAQLAQRHPANNAGIHADVISFWRAPRGPQQFLLPALVILQGILLLLLLAVCANTANLMLARASARQREIGVRRALGASAARIVSLLLTESFLLALLGAGVGILIASWGTNALRAGPMITAAPIRYNTSVDGVGLGVAVMLGLACGLAFGIAPALQLLRGQTLTAFRSGTGITTRSSMRSTLMATQVALALVVLVCAALFLQSFGETRNTDPGFERAGVLLVAYDLSGRNLDDDTRRTFAATLLQRLRAVPEIESAAIARMVPLDIHGMPVRSFRIEGRAPEDAALDQAAMNIVTPGYFATLGIPLLQGSDFADLNDATAAPQVIVNQAFVARFLAGAEPIGRRIQTGDRTYVIAGVVGTTLYNSFGEEPTPLMHFSYRERPSMVGEIHVRTRPGTEAALAPTIQRIVRAIDPLLPVYDVRTLDEHVEKNLIFRRIPARMFVVLGPLLLLLAAIGIYAVVAFSVSRRTAEIGLRLALGAPTRRVVTEIMGESLRVVAIGAGAGWFLVFMVYIHIAAGQPLHPTAFVGVPAILMLVAALASWVPARRASRVDPMTTLRQE